MRFRAGEPVAILGNQGRVICRGEVVSDPGPVELVTVRYVLGGHEYTEAKARSSLRPVDGRRDDGNATRRDDPEVGSDGSGEGPPQAHPGGAIGDAGAHGAGDPECVASVERDGAGDGGREPGPAHDDHRDRAREPGDAEGAAGVGDRGEGARDASAGEQSSGVEVAREDFKAARVRVESLERAIGLAVKEARKADAKHDRYNSAHEAYGVLAEEVAEFFDEVRKKSHLRSGIAMRNELAQVAAVAIRAIAMLEDPEVVKR